jgi:hypothetical protein
MFAVPASPERQFLATTLTASRQFGQTGLGYVMFIASGALYVTLWLSYNLCAGIRRVARSVGLSVQDLLLFLFRRFAAFSQQVWASVSCYLQVSLAAHQRRRQRKSLTAEPKTATDADEEVVAEQLFRNGGKNDVEDVSTDGECGSVDPRTTSRESETSPHPQKARKPRRPFDAEELDLLRALCTRAVAADDYRFTRGLAGSNIRLTQQFNAEMARRRPSYVPRDVENIGNRVNRDDFKDFLAAEAVPSQRKPGRRWSAAETAVLENQVFVLAKEHPAWFTVVNSELKLSSEFARLLVFNVTRAGIARTWHEIVDKAKRSLALVARLQGLRRQ